jgi:predicted  nucleic acid-binding Zn-ribbon protein
MHHDRSALLDLQRATQSLSGLSDREQIMTLKHELFHAIERSSDFQSRCIALEMRVAELEAQIRAQAGAEDALLRQLRVEHTTELRKLRLERFAVEVQCDALDELCRSLLLTIERAVDGDVDESGDSDRGSQPRVSAS